MACPCSSRRWIEDRNVKSHWHPERAKRIFRFERHPKEIPRHCEPDEACHGGRGCAPAISRRETPELCTGWPPSEKQEGAGKTGCALHPRSRVPVIG